MFESRKKCSIWEVGNGEIGDWGSWDAGNIGEVGRRKDLEVWMLLEDPVSGKGSGEVGEVGCEGVGRWETGNWRSWGTG